MAYVDDMVISGESSSVQKFFQEMQKVFSLKNVDIPRIRSLSVVLGPNHQEAKVRSDHNGFLSKAHRQFARLVWLTSRQGSLQMVSRFRRFPKKIRSNAIRKTHSLYRSALQWANCAGCLNSEMASHTQSRSSGSLSNPQEPDIENLKHLLKYISQTRDFIFVMAPQVPAPNSQGLIPTQIVSYSDSDWAGCQRQEDQQAATDHDALVNIASTSQTQASVPHSLAEVELCAMTQASAESLAIKHFVQEFGAKILSEMCTLWSRQIHQQAREWPHILAFQESQSTLSVSIYGFKTFSEKELSH